MFGASSIRNQRNNGVEFHCSPLASIADAIVALAIEHTKLKAHYRSDYNPINAQHSLELIKHVDYL